MHLLVCCLNKLLGKVYLCFFNFPLLTINPPLLHTHLSQQLPELCDSHYQALHFHILSFKL